jgi:DNA invertase Pin-like site-specific DNA recombinase
MNIQQPLRYCLYARKSTEQDERQAMSIGSQIKEMTDLANREQLQIVAVKQESYSAKASATRPIFSAILTEIREDRYDAILTWAPDRLARNAGDLGSLVDLMDEGKLQKIRTFGQSFSNTPNEKFLLMILGSQAKLENDNRGINVKRGLRAKCESGWRPNMPPLGYFTRGASGNGRDVIVDKERAPYIKKMFEMSADGKGGRYIRQWLEDSGVRTRGNKLIPLSAIYRMLKSSYYYGDFEHPRGSGNWYVGKHEPIISKELFGKVQEQLKVPPKTKWGSKQFPFKGIIRCYSCGSSLVGEQKLKMLKDGSTREHIYYHCSRQVDRGCKESFAREKDIINQLYELRHLLIPNKYLLEPGLRKEIEKTAAISGMEFEMAFDTYVKYALERGTRFERTRVVRNIETKLLLHERQLIIVNDLKLGELLN